MDRYRFALGGIVIAGFITLATAVALGKVEEKTSYGLVPILGILGKVGLDFSEWAFRRDDGPTPQPPPKPPSDAL